MQKNLNIEKITFKVVQMKFLAMHITNQIKFWYIYSRKFTKYLHGTWSLLNPNDFGIKEKWIILTHMYFWLLLQIYRCYLWLLSCSRVTYMKNYCWVMSVKRDALLAVIYAWLHLLVTRSILLSLSLTHTHTHTHTHRCSFFLFSRTTINLGSFGHESSQNREKVFKINRGCW